MPPGAHVQVPLHSPGSQGGPPGATDQGADRGGDGESVKSASQSKFKTRNGTVNFFFHQIAGKK